MRRNVAIGAGMAVGVLGALILGEYRFGGLSAFASALILGLFVSETVVTVGRAGGPVQASASAAIVAAGLVWAASISTGERLDTVPVEGWTAVVVGAGLAALRAWWPSREGDSRPRTPRTGSEATPPEADQVQPGPG